jgi:hypothetical protein
VRSGCWRVDRAFGLSGLDEVRRIEVPFNDVGEGGEVRLRGAFTRGYKVPPFETQGTGLGGRQPPLQGCARMDVRHLWFEFGASTFQ